MTDEHLVVSQVNVVARDLRRSLEFYRKLGVTFPRPLVNPAGTLFHASSEGENGATLELDSPEFAPVWNAGWAGRSKITGRVVLTFRLATREAVDERFERDGYRGLQPPFDAFWGARYAIIEDPDRVAIGLTSNIDLARGMQPPPEWVG